jgi:hypothetical protein
MIDGFFWWTGCLFWSAWLALLLTSLGPVLFRRRPTGSWYGTEEQRRALRDAKAEAHRVLGKKPLVKDHVVRATDLQAPL